MDVRGVLVLMVAVAIPALAQTPGMQSATMTERKVALDAVGSLQQVMGCVAQPPETLKPSAAYLMQWTKTHTWQGRPFIAEVRQGSMGDVMSNPAMKASMCRVTTEPATLAKLYRQISSGADNLRSLER